MISWAVAVRSMSSSASMPSLISAVPSWPLASQAGMVLYLGSLGGVGDEGEGDVEAAGGRELDGLHV